MISKLKSEMEVRLERKSRQENRRSQEDYETEQVLPFARYQTLHNAYAYALKFETAKKVSHKDRHECVKYEAVHQSAKTDI